MRCWGDNDDGESDVPPFTLRAGYEVAPFGYVSTGDYTFERICSENETYGVYRPDGANQHTPLVLGCRGCSLSRELVCATDAATLESISGDTGSESQTLSGVADQWYQIDITEDDTGFSGVGLSVTLTLQPPDGVDYDLRVYQGSCDASAQSSTIGGSASDSVTLAWDDGWGSDTTTLFVHVDYYSGDSCEPFTLTIEGNTAN